MPSWYNLFFATWGAAALFRYLEAGNRRWLFFAGLCGGLSFLAKITAAYYVAGVLLFFVFREQSSTTEKNRGIATRARFYSATVAFALAVFLLILFSVIHKVPGIAGLIYFVLPAVVLIVFLLARESAGIPGRDRQRFVALMDMCVPFGLGSVIPLMAFLIPYALAGSVHDLVHGLMATPTRAIRFASFAPQNPITMVTIIPFILPTIIAYECRRLGQIICGMVVALYGCAVLFFSMKSPLVYSLGWCSLATAIPVLVLAGVAILWTSRGQKTLSPIRQQQTMLILCVTALCGLVQFPFAAPVYFLYVAPLVILLAAALFASAARPPRMVLLPLIFFYLLFCALPVTDYQMGLRLAPDSPDERLTVARAGGLQVEASSAHLYDQLISLVQSHTAGKFIYAAPDCPEVYFLSGAQIPTRHYFDTAEDPVNHTNQTLHMLETLKVNVVAINNYPGFSEPLSSDLQYALELRYPHSTQVGKFQVRWKE
jgi:hypothetical protein